MKRAILLSIIFCTGISAQTAKVRWQPNTEEDLAGYKVYYGLQSRNYFESINSGNVTQQIINNLLTDTLYYFAVTAYDKSGNESTYSIEVKKFIKDNTIPIPIDTIPPAFPNGVEVEQVFKDTLFIWTAKEITEIMQDPGLLSGDRVGLWETSLLVIPIENYKQGKWLLSVNCKGKDGDPKLIVNGEFFYDISKSGDPKRYEKIITLTEQSYLSLDVDSGNMWFFGDRAIEIKYIGN